MDWNLGFGGGETAVRCDPAFVMSASLPPSLWWKTTAATSGGTASPAAYSHSLREENSLLSVPPRSCQLPAAQQAPGEVEKLGKLSRYTSIYVRTSQIKQLIDSFSKDGCYRSARRGCKAS